MSRVGPAGALLAIVLLVGLGAAAAPLASGSHDAPAAFASVDQIEPDAVVLDVTVAADGDATWEIRYRVRLDDDNESAAFDSLERDIEENRSAYTGRFEERMERTVEAAANATGREMAVENVTVRTTHQEIPQRYGVLIYGFDWTNFAEVEGSRVTVGDAIAGLFLDESTSLTVRWPAAYGVASADPDPDDSGDRSATWQGPRDFGNDRPRLVLSTEAGSGADGGGPGGDAGEDGGLSSLVVALVALGAAVAAVGAGLWWRGRQPAGTESAAVAAEPPEELLSNEERVLRLLRRHGGRMKQQQVVEELGWTDAKTSQVVGDLRDSGEIEAFRLGRENVLSLPSADDDDRIG